MSPEDTRRAPSWNIEIVKTLLGTEGILVGHDRRWDGFGGFSVDTRDGAWFSFAIENGGYSTARLVQFLDSKLSRQEALELVQDFLRAHPGVGPGNKEVPDDDISEGRTRARAAYARRIITERRLLAADDDGMRYLESRGLAPPFPLDIWWLPDARAGEGAIVVDLVADNRVVAILLIHVDARGRKSVVAPARQRFNLEPHRPDAVMVVAEPQPGVVDIAADTITVEGLENGLTVALVRHPAWRISGLPGIGARPQFRKGERVIHFQDSDPPSSAAAQGLQNYTDAAILAEAVIRVTEFSEAGDANAILQAEGKGAAEVKRLLAKPAGAALSFGGDVERLSKLPPTEYEKARKHVAHEHGVRVSHLDREVTRLRPRPTEAADGSAPGLITLPEDPEWAGPIPQLSTLLNKIAEVFRRFVAVTEAQLTAIVLWIAAAHLVHSPEVGLELFPHLAIESKDPNSGKTTLLELVWNCLPRAKLWTYPTGALLARALDLVRPSICLDELQYAKDPNLLRIIDASHKRALAYVPVLVLDKDGNYVPHEFNVWVPMAMARLGEFSPAQQSRSILIWMLPKLPGEPRERRRSPVVPELMPCRQQLIAWAKTVPHWADPKLPATLQNRDLDNWEPLLFVAEQASEQWPELAQKSVEALMKVETAPTLTARLLRSIWEIYQPDPEQEPIPFLSTADLLAKLIADQDEEWNEIGPGGRAITAQWLREKLRHLLEPPGSQREDRLGPRGYAFRQFRGALDRYFGAERPEDPIIDVSEPTSPEPSGASGASGTTPSKTAKKPAPDAPHTAGSAPDARAEQAGTEALDTASESASSAPVAPVAPDGFGGSTRTHADGATAAVEIGAFVQWTSGGVDQFEEPRRVVGFFEGRTWARVEGSATGIPTVELTVVRPAPAAPNGLGPASPVNTAIDPTILETILAYRAEHPDASVDSIRRHLKIKKSTVAFVLRELGL